jgi:hypothetical protein
VLNSADYALAWPRELFAHEARLLLDAEARTDQRWFESAALLLEEAFAGPAARDAVLSDHPAPGSQARAAS